jgi:hypothetical protein
MTYSRMRGSDYLLQENKTKAFFTSGNRCRERIVQRFNPGVEIVHVIAKKFNPVNRAEFNPGVESSPCNRPLRDVQNQACPVVKVRFSLGQHKRVRAMS